MENLKLALACLHSCDSLIDDIRHHSVDENDKISLGEIANEVYEDAVRISIAISEVTVDSKKFKEEAFYFAEKSKSAVLQESIADAQAKSFSGIPNELLEQEKNLKSTITYLSQKLSMKPDTNEERGIRESLFASNQEYTAFIMKLERNYPNYYNLKFNQASPTVSSLQKNLGENNCIVSYFVASKNKRVYQFIIQKKQFKVVSKSMPDDFDKLVRGFNNSLYYSDFDTYTLTAGTLKKILVPKLPGSIKHIIIIPSGRLGTMPFEALPVSLGKGDSFSNMEFLLNKYSISYEFSSALMEQKDQKEATSSNSIFLCAPVNFSDGLPELPGSEKEVATISELFGSNSKVASHKDASETKIKNSNLSEYSYLHFATHGTVDETSPELSRIFLNSSESDDGSLYSGEIFNLQLNANLAVLSACQTGLGKLSKGEGVIGLSRALTYAGAKNIIVSFWSVADESTSELMTELYREILQNKNDFSSSLRNSKLKLISNPKFSAPYYWAPFVMIGN
jgi:CHAT domain-containing protein